MLRDGKLNFYWIQVNNNLQAAPNISRGAPGLPKCGQLVVVSDAYPTVTAMTADLVLPAASQSKRKAPTATRSNAPMSHGDSVNARGGTFRPLADHGVSKHFTTDEGGLRSTDRSPDLAARRCSTSCFERRNRQLPSPKLQPSTRTTRRRPSDLCAEGAVRGVH